jgi:hypothetical protein
MDLGTVLDLGETPREEQRGALAAYATDLLRGHDLHEDAGTSRIRRELADAMASRLARSDTRDGEFLMAGLWARELLSGPSAAPTREALTQVPDDLGEMLSRGLGGQGRSPWERPVLMTLAHAEGAGMPERVLRRAVEAFTSDGLVPSLDELRTALDAAAFYVRQETDDDGSPLYHLSHQGLADRLFDGSRSVALFDALLAAAGGTSPRTETARPALPVRDLRRLLHDGGGAPCRAVFFREVAAYLREPGDVREGAREEVATAIAAHAPNIVVAHSLGSVVAYEALHAHPGLRVPLLLTLGSPLGLPFAVHERLRPAPVSGMGRRPAGVETWVNIAHPGDPVAIPPRLARRFHGIAQDLTGTAGHLNPHAVAGYLRSATVAGALTFWLT